MSVRCLVSVLGVLLALGVPASADAPVVYERVLSDGGAIRLVWDRVVLESQSLQVVGGNDAFDARSGDPLSVMLANDLVQRVERGSVAIRPALTLSGADATVLLRDVTIIAAGASAGGRDFTLFDESTGLPAFYVDGSSWDFDPVSRVLTLASSTLRISEALASRLHQPASANAAVGSLEMSLPTRSLEMMIDQASSGAAAPLDPSPTDGGIVERSGPDCVLAQINHVARYGPVGSTYAYAIASSTCNIGNADLRWIFTGSPGLAMNAYRLHNGRLMQIGMSWVKTACCAAAHPFCNLECNGNDGAVLGVGCMDAYSSGWNGLQFNLQSRSNINAFTGTFASLPPFVGNAIDRRLQVSVNDLSPSLTGALYFVEGVYVTDDDGPAGNAANNASHRRVTVDASYNMTVADDNVPYVPAIAAWRANGLGVGAQDDRVESQVVAVPGEGLFHVASKVTELGGGRWLYDYAIFNLNSDRAAASLRIPTGVAMDVPPESVGFHDVDYHSGEVYDNTDWTVVKTALDVTWASPQTFAQNPNANAIRWATMYNFWFEADRPPVLRSATMGLFKPHSPQSLSFVVRSPAAPGDVDLDGDVDLTDLASVLSVFGCMSGCPFDVNGDGAVDLVDLATLLANYGS